MVDPKVAEPVRWLGETFGFWVQTGVLAVSAVGGIWIILSRGKQEQRRATVDFIAEQKRDKEHNEARDVIKRMHDDGETNLARFLHDRTSVEYKAIMVALDHYEFTAAGIRTKAFSEEVFKRLRCSVLIRDWESFRGFVDEFRKLKGKNTFFQDFEWLYRRWKKKPLRTDGD